MLAVLENAANWIRDAISKLGLEERLSKIGLTAAEVGQAAVFFGVGVASGFLSRKYFKIFVVSSVVAFLVLKWLELKGLLVVDWAVLNKMLGIESGVEVQVQGLVSLLSEWAKVHVLLAGSLVVGFYVGFRLA